MLLSKFLSRIFWKFSIMISFLSTRDLEVSLFKISYTVSHSYEKLMFDFLPLSNSFTLDNSLGSVLRRALWLPFWWVLVSVGVSASPNNKLLLVWVIKSVFLNMVLTFSLTLCSVESYYDLFIKSKNYNIYLLE
jgi:hypothetical protein